MEAAPLTEVGIHLPAEDSGFEALTPSESDKECENTTAPDLLANETKEPLIFKKNSSQSSSFVQNILYEDSCTGVTVIDLFIALKAIKENLEFISKSNEKMSDRMCFLNEETETAWKEFVELLESMRMFLDKMNTDASNFNLQNLENKFSNMALTNDGHNFDTNKSKSKTKWECAECGRDENESYKNESKKFKCLGCLVSAFKEISLCQLSVSPEAFLCSFLASLLYWQKGQERERKPNIIRSSSSALEEIKSDGSLNIKESTVQMICDICEILNVAAFRERDEHQSVIQLGSTSGSCTKNPVDMHDELDWSNGASGVSKEKCLYFKGNRRKIRTGESAKERIEIKGELTSEGDSEFEEALTCQMNDHHDLGGKPSMTCMGDLSKAVVEKKSASTITPTNNIFSSWVGKLSDIIKSKIKQIKSKRKNKTKVKVFEKPFEKSETALKKRPGMLQFSITARTSAGVFDVTVVQYKKHHYLAKSTANCSKNAQLALGSDSKHSIQNFRSPLLKDCKDEFWSDESLGNSQSDSMETCSNYGDDDMVEFLEIYLENKDKGDFQNNVPVSNPISHQIGELRNLEVKTGKTHFLEMHSWYAVYFVQEFIKKTRKTELNEPAENGNMSNDASEEEIFSLNSGEKEEKQIVIKGSSSDLVIYIQVRVEDDLEPNSSCVLFDFEKSSLRTQPKENDPQMSSTFVEKAIRLSEDEKKGESLYNIWRAREMNQVPEAEDMERSTFEEPFMMIEKSEEEKREVNKYQEKMKEKSVSFREDLSEMFDEKEIQDTFLEEVTITDRANVLVIREIKQSAQIWHHQIPKRWKSEILRLRRNPKLSRDIIESINSSAGELRKALGLIREIENDIVDAQFEDAISILPRLDLELRKHLQAKIKGLEVKETKNRMSTDNFFSSFDLYQRDDSIDGDSDESSEYRFNNLLNLLTNLEDAVKASEHASNKIEPYHFDSSKIYELLHALADSIRELEEVPNVTSLSQTLDIASRLDYAIREYDSIVKKQPADYLTPQERNKKRRKPRWNTKEEASVTQHLKNVRKKVFEMVEMEAVGMEDRIQRDFDRLDRLEMENDEAMMFLETLIQKMQKRVSEFQNLKADLKAVFSSVNTLYENYKKAAFQEKKEKMEVEKLEGNLKKSSERISDRILDPSSERILRKKFKNKVQERYSERIPERVSELSTEKTLKKNSGRSPQTTSVKIPDETLTRKLERAEKEISEKQSEIFSGSTPSDVSKKTSDRISERSSTRSSENFPEKISEKVSDKSLERNSRSPESTAKKKMSEESSKRSSKNISEESLEKKSRSSKSPEEISEKNSENSSSIIVSERISRKTPEKILEIIQEEETPKNSKAESPSVTPLESFSTPTNQESLEQIVSSFINAIDYVKSKSKEGKNEAKVIPPLQGFEKTQSLKNLPKPNQLSSTIIEFKAIGQNSLYLSWTEPVGSSEGFITGYEIYVDGKLNQRVRNPQRVQAVLYSVNLSKKIQVQLYAIVENNDKVLLASMDLNGE